MGKRLLLLSVLLGTCAIFGEEPSKAQQIKEAKSHWPTPFMIFRNADCDWNKAIKFSLESDNIGFKTDKKREAAMLHDGTTLFIRLTDREVQGELANATPMKTGDFWMVLLAGGKAGGPLREIVAAPDQRVEFIEHERRPDGIRTGKTRNLDVPVQVRSHCENGVWTVILAVPLKEAIAGGVVAGNNIFPNIFRGRGAENIQAWSPTFGRDLYVPWRLGKAYTQK